MAEIDAFGAHWEHVGADCVPLAKISGCDVVPMSIGTVAMLIVARPHSAQSEGEVNTQVVMAPSAARKIAAALIEAANKVSSTG